MSAGRVCLVANEALGAHKNGGIGTATSHLAVLLALNGFESTILLFGGAQVDPSDPWSRRYEQAGVRIVHFAEPEARFDPEWARTSVHLYERLRDEQSDIILFQDIHAPGFASMVAKASGRAFRNTVLATVTHGNATWVREAGRAFPTELRDIGVGYMEQRQIELSDAVVSPSAYLVEWMRGKSWALPTDASVLPLFLEGRELLDPDDAAAPEDGRVLRPNHVTFFGRLEERKGISVFLRALACADLADQQFGITILGKEYLITTAEIRDFLSRHRPDLLARTEFLTGLSSDEAQFFLETAQTVAVVPSLVDNSPCVISEALKLRLPLIASRTGGIPELVAAADRDRCLFEPTPEALAAKLREVLTAAEWSAPAPATTMEDRAAGWLDWAKRQTAWARRTPTAAEPPCEPDVTVVLTHFERPKLIVQALRGFARQTDRNFRLIVVDDGSRSEEAQSFLRSLDDGFDWLRPRVIRQENSYLGAARNAGLRAAETPFVIFFDDDNVPLPTMIETLRQSIHASGADIVTCQTAIFYSAEGEPPLETDADTQRWGCTGGPIALGAVMNCFGDATAIYRRDLFDEIGGFHEIHGVTHEDWQLHLRAAIAGKRILALPEALFWYRATPTSMARSTDLYANMEVVRSAFDPDVPPELRPLLDMAIGLYGPRRSAA